MTFTRAVFVFVVFLLHCHSSDAQTYTFDKSSDSFLENVTTATVTVTRTGSTSSPASVDVTATWSGTNPATAVTDFSVPTAVTFDVGEATASLILTIIDDSDIEQDETLTLTLTANDGGTVTPTGSMDITIQDNDAAAYSIGFASDSAFKLLADESQQDVVLTIERTPTTGTAAVNYAFSGAATFGSDYTSTAASGTLNFVDGVASQTITLSIQDDNLSEEIELILVTLSSTDTHVVLQTPEAKVYIPKNDDTGLVSTSYNCFRDGQDCNNQAQCVSGVCDCASAPNGPFGGYDCTFKTVDTSSGACGGATPHDCGVHAQCYDPAGTGALCFCDIGYIKDATGLCTVPRYRVACTKDFMTLVATPAGTFDGDIFIKDKYDVTACHFTKDGNDYTMTTLLNNGSDCGDAVVQDLGSGNYKVKRSFRVEYNTQYTTVYDETINAECNTADTTQIAINISPMNVDTSGLVAVSGNGVLDIVSMEMTNDDGDVVMANTQLKIGDYITFKLSVNPASYKGIALLTMTVDNNLADGAAITNKLVTARCVDSSTKLISPPGPTHPDGNIHIVSVRFRLIVYKQSSQIRLSFRSKICLLGDADCDIQCNSRRKRSAGNETGTKDFNVVLNIQQPYSTHQTGQEFVKECVHSTTMVAAVATMTVVMVILLFVCLALFVRSLSANRNPHKNLN